MRTPRFLVDSTAVRLSKWLRFLGLDVVLDRSESPSRLLVRARRESRVLLTRRRDLGGATAAETVLLNSDYLDEQLRQIAAAFELAVDFSSRCTVCNSELVVVPRVNADGRVPEFVYRSQCEFAFCHDCDKYYWKGSHWQSVRNVSILLSDGVSEPEKREKPLRESKPGKESFREAEDNE